MGPMQRIQRPGYGKIGEVRNLVCNHFLLNAVFSQVQAYRVSFLPGDYDESLRFHFWKLAKANLDNKGQFAFYDGDETVYIFGKLSSNEWTGVVNVVQDRLRISCRVILHLMYENLRYDRVIEALDVMMRETLNGSHVVVGPFFGLRPLDGQIGQWIKNGVVAFEGFSQNACQTQNGFTLNIDTAAMAFFECMKVSDFVSRLGFNIGFPLSDNDRIQVEQILVGIVVKTDEFPDLKIKWLSNCPEQDLKFEMADALKWSDADEEDETLLGGGLVSANKYFSILNLHSEHKAFPALRVDRKPFYVPMEECTILPEQHYSHLNDYENRSLVEITKKDPKKRFYDIKKIVKKLYKDGGKSLGVPIDVDNGFLSFQYRVLPPPELKYKGTTVGLEHERWNREKKEMCNAKQVHNGWACINFSKLKMNEVNKFCQHLISVCCEFGMVMDKTSLFPIRSPRNIENFVWSKIKLRSKIDDGTLHLLIIILPDDSNEYYGLINKACDMRLGIVSQCCQPSKVAQCQADYMEDLALKINVKLVGQNAILETRELFKENRFLTDGKGSTLFFGVTINYPTPGDDSTSSIVGVVASMNWPELSRYKAVFFTQPSKEKAIKPDVLKLLVRIIISRDICIIIGFEMAQWQLTS